MAVQIQFFFIEGCPNRRLARSNLDIALARAGLDHVAIEEHVVGWDDDHVPPQMNGSPTILIDGVDPFSDGAARHSLSCRVYRTSRGVNGAPTPEELFDALNGANPGATA